MDKVNVILFFLFFLIINIIREIKNIIIGILKL